MEIHHQTRQRIRISYSIIIIMAGAVARQHSFDTSNLQSKIYIVGTGDVTSIQTHTHTTQSEQKRKMNIKILFGIFRLIHKNYLNIFLASARSSCLDSSIAFRKSHFVVGTEPESEYGTTQQKKWWDWNYDIKFWLAAKQSNENRRRCCCCVTVSAREAKLTEWNSQIINQFQSDKIKYTNTSRWLQFRLEVDGKFHILWDNEICVTVMHSSHTQKRNIPKQCDCQWCDWAEIMCHFVPFVCTGMNSTKWQPFRKFKLKSIELFRDVLLFAEARMPKNFGGRWCAQIDNGWYCEYIERFFIFPSLICMYYFTVNYLGIFGCYSIWQKIDRLFS